MPSPTFFKLPEAKRNRFVAVAVDEFASAGYEKASISKMVKKLRIAKGSVYQYFENKKELYFYLMEIAQAKRYEYMREVLRNPPESFFELFAKLFTKSIQFEYENPQMSALLANASYERYSDDLGNLMLAQKKKSLDFMRGLLEKEFLRGGLRYDIDLDVMAFFAANISGGIWDYLTLKNLNTEADRKGLKKIPKESIDKLLGDLSKLLKTGLKA
jgi:AcrR family transcriptional regulator